MVFKNPDPLTLSAVLVRRFRNRNDDAVVLS